MRRYPRFSTKQTKRGVVAFDKWLGVNSTDSNASLLPGYVPYAKNVDFSRDPGAAAKRLGTEALFASLGAGGCLGVHTYKHSSGDRILLAWDDDVYKLTGDTSTLTKTTQADWDAGTLTDLVSTASGTVELGLDTSSFVLDQSDTNATLGEILGGATANMGQRFTTGVGTYNLAKISPSATGGSWIAGETVTLKVWEWDTDYATTVAAVALATIAVDGPQSNGYVPFVSVAGVAVSPSTDYFFEMSINTGAVTFQGDGGAAYAAGSIYRDGTADAAVDLTFKTYLYPYEASGTWTSPVYDLTNTPVAASMAFTTTTPANTSVTMYAKGSQDNVNWGSWQVVSVSGDGIPLARYVQVKAALATTDTASTPVLSDFTITYETSFTTATSIYSGIDGNKVRFVDWNEKCYFAFGGIPQVYDGETVRNVNTPLSVEDCEDAWNEQVIANVTTGTDGSDKKVGNACIKLTVADAKGTGILASEVIASADLSTYDSIRLWVKSSVNLDSGDLQILLDNTALCASPLETLDIPAVTADTWTLCTLDLAAAASDTAIISIGVQMAVDKGAFVLRLDDVNAIYDSTYPVELTQVRIINFWKNYAMYADDSDLTKLYVSSVNAPGTIPTDGYKQMPNSILGYKGYNDALIITGYNFTKSMFGTIFDGSADDDTAIKDLGSEYAVSHEAMIVCVDENKQNILVFGTNDGPKVLVPGLQEQSLQVVPFGSNVQKYFSQSIERQNQVFAFNKQGLYCAICFNEEGAAVAYTNNVVMKYDFKARQWSGPWALNVAGFCIAAGTDNSGYTQSDELFIVGSTIGRLYQMEKGNDDAGSNIVYTLDTAYLGEMWNLREYQWLRIAVSDASVTTTMALTAKIDNNSDSISPGATTTWNVGSWGGDAQGKQDVIVSPNQLINAPPGHYFGLRISDDSTNDFILYGIEAGYIEYVGVV